MTLGGEVHDRIGRVVEENPAQGLGVGDVAVDEGVTRVVFQVGQRGGMARVGKFVQVNHACRFVRGEDVA